MIDTEEQIVYTLIPKKEKINNNRNNNLQGNTLSLIANVKPNQKNLSTKQLQYLLRNNNYILVSTNVISEEFLEVARMIEKSVQTIDIEDIKIYSRNRYVETVFKQVLTSIKTSKFNANLTIGERINELCDKYYYTFDDELEFYIFIYRCFEMIYLKTSNTTNSVLYERYFHQKNDFVDKNDLIELFCKDYDSYTKFKFRVVPNSNQNQEYTHNLIIATEDIMMPIMFEAISTICCNSDSQRYDFCSNENCRNLFRKLRKNQTHCRTDECLSDLVQQSKKKHKDYS